MHPQSFSHGVLAALAVMEIPDLRGKKRELAAKPATAAPKRYGQARERARRLRQIAAAQLTASNGLV